MKRLQGIWVRRLTWNHMCETQAAFVFSTFVHNSIWGRDCSSVRLSVHPFPVLSFSLSERVTFKLRVKRESERVCERLRKRMRERAQFRQKRMKWIIRYIARANDIQKPYAIYFSRSYGRRDGWKAINPTLVQKSWTIGCKSTHLLCSCHVMRVMKLDDAIGQFIAHQVAKSCATRFADTFLMFLCIPMRGVIDLSQSVKEFLLLCGIFSFSMHAVESYSTWKSSICLAHVVNFCVPDRWMERGIHCLLSMPFHTTTNTSQGRGCN